ncbi:MAG: hypothetical protein RIC56_15875 [Pseudomonadales bacterium]
MTRGKGKSTLVLEQAILPIVEERAPITVRGVAYKLFADGLISSMAKNETQKVSRIMTAMREADELDWTKIVDGSRPVNRANVWKDPAEIVAAAVRGYRRDYWQDQPVLVEVWSEKSTVEGILQPVLDEFGVTFRVIKGFGSYTRIREAAEESTHGASGRDFVALYIGDHDPSGMYMSEVDLPRRLKRYGSRGLFERIAVLPDDTIGLPPFQAKRKDPRYSWYVRQYGTNCWELDAMNPSDLRDRVRQQIETRLDLPLWENAKRIERVEVESMQDFNRTIQSLMESAS